MNLGFQASANSKVKRLDMIGQLLGTSGESAGLLESYNRMIQVLPEEFNLKH